MFCKFVDQFLPEMPPLGHCCDRLVPKGMLNVSGRKLPRHKAKFDEGPDVALQQAVVYLIDIREIVASLTLVVFAIDSDFVVKDSVKTDILKVCNFLDGIQVTAVALSQRQNSTSRAKNDFPEVRERADAATSIYRNGVYHSCSSPPDL